MKVLIVGGGGREHVLAWKIAQSPLLTELYCAPGNGGTEELAKNLSIKDTDLKSLLDFARSEKIDLTVVGPEAPLVEGIVDLFQAAGLPIFGPDKEAARLEGSKVFAKEFMKRHFIPTARFEKFQLECDVREYVQTLNYHGVIKVDGLAAGKGAFVCHNLDEVNKALHDIYTKDKFGNASNQVIVEDILTGEELSIFALCNGTEYRLLSPAQDHKQVFDNDRGPNTGGMGAYAPAPLATPKLIQKVEKEVIIPTLEGMAEEGHSYKGVLYCGLMVKDDSVNVLEYNCRFGDPEAQVVIPLIKSDLLEILYRIAKNESLPEIEIHDKYATCVVLASGGYPGSYKKGLPIQLEEKFDQDVYIFHAGTKKQDGQLLTNGGRVLSLVAMQDSLEASIQKVYQNITKINFDKMHYRTDIGQKGLKRIKEQ